MCGYSRASPCPVRLAHKSAANWDLMGCLGVRPYAVLQCDRLTVAGA